MLRLTVSTEEYIQLGENVRIAFLGGSKNHLRIMVEAPRELNVVRGKVIEKRAGNDEEKANLPHYYAVPDLPEKYRKKRVAVNDSAKMAVKQVKAAGKRQASAEKQSDKKSGRKGD